MFSLTERKLFRLLLDIVKTLFARQGHGRGSADLRLCRDPSDVR